MNRIFHVILQLCSPLTIDLRLIYIAAARNRSFDVNLLIHQFI